MKAVVKMKDGHDGWEIQEKERVAPGDDEVEMKVMAAGICGSELHLYHDNHYYKPGAVVGHEYSGVISRVGKNVTKYKVGDRIITENRYSSCGNCEYCRTGNMGLCKEAIMPGYILDGGWRNYAVIPTKQIIKIPDNVSYEEASVVEPAAVLMEALTIKEPIRANETVLIQGCGTIGLLACMVAKAAGAGTVIVTGTDVDEEIRIPVAKEVGADYVINVQKEDLIEKIMEITDGKGVDYIAECSGAPSAIKSCFYAIKKLGRIVAIGEAPVKEIGFDWNKAVFTGATLKFHYGSDYVAWHRVVDMMSNGKIDVKPLITHEIPMEDFRKGFEMLDNKEAIKVVMHPFADEY